MVINVFILSLGRCYECFYTYLFLLNEFSIPSLQALVLSKYYTFMSLGRISGLFNFHIIYEEIPTINMVKCDIFTPSMTCTKVDDIVQSTLCTHFTPPLKLVHIVTIILLSSTCYKVVDQIAMVASNVVHCNLRGPQEEYQMYLYHTKTA